MRHNQNARRMRGGRSNGHNGGHHHNGQRGRVNPRVQTFDSNGPDVRIRGTAYQINEKYVTLARDATSAGDRVLAESYLQHAEHYQRFINEMTEEQPQPQQQNPQNQPQPVIDGKDAAAEASAENLNDLDQGFLVGPRQGNGADTHLSNGADTHLTNSADTHLTNGDARAPSTNGANAPLSNGATAPLSNGATAPIASDGEQSQVQENQQGRGQQRTRAARRASESEAF